MFSIKFFGFWQCHFSSTSSRYFLQLLLLFHNPIIFLVVSNGDKGTTSPLKISSAFLNNLAGASNDFELSLFIHQLPIQLILTLVYSRWFQVQASKVSQISKFLNNTCHGIFLRFLPFSMETKQYL